jgi:hypothetical protein
MPYHTLFTTFVFYRHFYTLMSVLILAYAQYLGFWSFVHSSFLYCSGGTSALSRSWRVLCWQRWKCPNVCGPILGTCTSTNKIGCWIGLQSYHMASNCISRRMSFQVSEDAKVLIIHSIDFGSFWSESCILLIAFTNKPRMGSI